MGEIRHKLSELNTVGWGEVSLDTDVVESLDKLKFASFLLSDVQDSLIVIVSLDCEIIPFIWDGLRMSSQLNCSGESLELDLEISITALSIESVALAKTEAYHVINLVVVVDELITEDCFNHDIVIACVIYIHEDPNSTSSTPSFWESFFA